MEKEIGKVTKIEADWMNIKIPVREGCNSCSVKSACSFVGPDSAYRYLKLPQKPGILEGDQVVLETKESVQNISALIVFVLPIFLIIGCYLLAKYFFQIPNSKIWGTLVAFVLYGAVLYLSNLWLSRLPVFLSKIVKVEKKL